MTAVVAGRVRQLAAAIISMTAVLTLAACDVFNQSAPPACPRIVVPRDAAQVTVYCPGPGRDLIDVMQQGSIEDIKMNCRLRKGRLVVELTIDLVGVRGPASPGPSANLPYFVAIADRAGSILAKEVFDSELTFLPGRRRTGVREVVEQVIPLGPEQSGANFEALVGFQLSRDQLEQNRRRRN